MYESITITSSIWVPVNIQVLVCDGRVVRIGWIGEPIEGAVFDEVVMNPEDIDRLIGYNRGVVH